MNSDYSSELGPHLNAVSSFGLSSARQTWMYWIGCSRGHQVSQGLEHLMNKVRLKKLGLFSLVKSGIKE